MTLLSDLVRVMGSSPLYGRQHSTQRGKSLDDAKLKLENASPKEAKTLPGIIVTHEAELRRLLYKRTTMRKMFAVIDLHLFMFPPHLPASDFPSSCPVLVREGIPSSPTV
jgi:hypothetical protein